MLQYGMTKSTVRTKAYVVTGGAQGIGAAIAQHLIKHERAKDGRYGDKDLKKGFLLAKRLARRHSSSPVILLNQRRSKPQFCRKEL